MTDIQPAPEKEEEKSIAPSDMAPWKLELGKVIWALVTSGAVTGGGVMAVLSGTKLPEIALGAAAGGLFSGAGALGYAYVDPMARRAKKGAKDAGNKTVEAIDWSAEQLWAKATKVETKYCLAQAEVCEGYRPEAMRQYETIRKPMLRDVFVPLELDGQAMQAGYGEDAIAIASLQDDLSIWKLLQRAQTDKAFRRIAVLAWGGFGKTTLLRHVAYTFGRGEQGRYGVKERVPVLILLRQHKKLFAQQEIPPLPELIQTVHLPSLDRAAELEMPQNWAKTLLESGRAIVMFDGFDELNLEDRSTAAQWMNRQMSRYSDSVFMITSRPKAFKDQPLASQLDVTMPIWVRKFGPEKQRIFIEQWYRCQERMAAGETKETESTKREALREAGKLLDQINDRPELQALATNPLLLNMIVTFHRRRPWGTLPVLRSDLYREICQLQIVDRPEARNVETILPGVDALAILQRLALEMMKRQIQRISHEEIIPLIRGYLQADGESGIDPGRFVDDVVNVSELLIDQGDEYDFAHLSFQEYLAAVEIVRLKQEEMLYKKLTDDRWKAVTLYYAGLVRNPSDLITRILGQGSTSLASECLKEAKRIDSTVTAAIATLTQQVKTNRYAQLEKLLKAKKWEEADRETEKVMLQVAEQEERGFLMPDDLEKFPCEDLLAIDRLWVDASNERFGFSVQKKIWEDCGSPQSAGEDWDRFCDRVGWKQKGKYVGYSALRKDPLHSPAGELPTIPTKPNYIPIYLSTHAVLLFSRALTCEL
jgi:hypothetical protein